MMIMRPPQQGQECVGFSGSAGLVNGDMFGGVAQRLRGSFAEQCSVDYRKAAKLPKAVTIGNAGDGRLEGVRTKERLPHKMHSAQSEKPDRSHAQMFFEGARRRRARLDLDQ